MQKQEDCMDEEADKIISKRLIQVIRLFDRVHTVTILVLFDILRDESQSVISVHLNMWVINDKTPIIFSNNLNLLSTQGALCFFGKYFRIDEII